MASPRRSAPWNAWSTELHSAKLRRLGRAIARDLRVEPRRSVQKSQPSTFMNRAPEERHKPNVGSRLLRAEEAFPARCRQSSQDPKHDALLPIFRMRSQSCSMRAIPRPARQRKGTTGASTRVRSSELREATRVLPCQPSPASGQDGNRLCSLNEQARDQLRRV
jgi:hypothetical protein